jgi:hypothetical protein
VGVGEKFFQAGRAITILPIRLGRFMIRLGLGMSVVCRLSIRKQTSFYGNNHLRTAKILAART